MSQNPRFSHFTRRQILAGLLASTASAAIAGAPKQSTRPKTRTSRAHVQAEVSAQRIIDEANLTGKIGFVVADAKTGEILESHNPMLTFPPASVTKTITTLYGLGALGDDYRFFTRIITTAPLVNGKVDGDLYLVGGGDPMLDTDALGDLLRQLKESGLREITGNAYVYSEALPYQKIIDPTQPIYLGFDPSLSGLNLNYNRVFFQWKRLGRGYQTTMEARALKFRPRIATETMKVVTRRAPVFTVDITADGDAWTVARHSLGRTGGRWLPVRRPGAYTAEVFYTLAPSFGITLPQFKPVKTVPKGTILAIWQSDILSEVLREMLKYSTNLTAEVTGLTASQERGGTPATLIASGRLMTNWVHATTAAKHMMFWDHSGLDDRNRISASDMVKVLQETGWDGPLRELMKEIKFHDKHGRPLKNQAIKVHAKTGTLNFISALAGYVDPPKGRKLIFAIFSGDLPRRAHIPESQRERPRGERSWNLRAKWLQQQLIERWVTVY